MAFTKSYRLERVYFERLKSMIDILKPYLNEETDEKLKAILENSIDDNGAILLLYRNLGEAWAELSDLIKKADEKIDQTKEEAEKYHDELNERIDEVNNYIMGLIRILEETKQDKLTPGDNITIDENNVISATGGSNIFVINATYDEQTSNPRLDKTYAEIYDAYTNGDTIIMYHNDGGYQQLYDLDRFVNDKFKFRMYLTDYDIYSGDLYNASITVDNTNTTAYDQIQVLQSPWTLSVSANYSSSTKKYTLNKTASEIVNKLEQRPPSVKPWFYGKTMVIAYNDGNTFVKEVVLKITQAPLAADFEHHFITSTKDFYAASGNDYPSYTMPT